VWTIGMAAMLVVAVALTEHFGWGIEPVRL
jgi:hypothetical protein